MYVRIIAVNNEFVDEKEQRTLGDIWSEEKINRFWEEKFWKGTLTIDEAREKLKKYGYVMWEDNSDDPSPSKRRLAESAEEYRKEGIKLNECSIWKWVDVNKRIPRTEFEGDIVYLSINGTTSQQKLKRFLNMDNQ